MSMEIEVLSCGPAVMGAWLGTAKQLAAYDEDVTKPALLYGDSVVLRSGNFMVRAELNMLLERMAMPLQQVVLVAKTLEAEGAREYLANHSGARPEELLTRESCAQFLHAWRTHTAAADGLEVATAWVHSEDARFDRTVSALIGALGDESDLLFRSELKMAVDEGVLRIRSFDDGLVDPIEDWREIRVGGLAESADFLNQSVEGLIRILRSGDRTCLLDAAAYEVAADVGEAPNSPLALAAEAGISLVQNLPVVTNASVAEVMDLRREFRAPLVRFRAAMLEAAMEFDRVDSIDIAADFYEHLIVSKVRPSVVEIEEEIQDNRYISELLTVISNPADVVASAGVLAIAVASGAAPVIPLLAAVAGVTSPVARAAIAKRRGDRRIERNGMFLLHKLGWAET